MLYPLTDAHAITRDASPFDLDGRDGATTSISTRRSMCSVPPSRRRSPESETSRAPEKLDRANVYDVQPQMWTYEGADKHRAFVLAAGLGGIAEAREHPHLHPARHRVGGEAGERGRACAPRRISPRCAIRPADRGRAEDTVKSFELAPGFKATAIASEPLINKPIAMQWDARGRLWVAETPEYPNGRRPLSDAPWKETGVLKPDNYDRPATDRISILEDTDGDGVMDKKTVFCTGLELVTGFCLYRDGVIVVLQPDIVFIHGEGDEAEGRAALHRLHAGRHALRREPFHRRAWTAGSTRTPAAAPMSRP